MKFHLNSGEGNRIRACEDAAVVINARRYERSLIVSPALLIDDWPPASADALDEAALTTAAAQAAEGAVVLLGIGGAPAAAKAEWHAPFIRRGAVLEVMSLRAACRTYNILTADNRAVVAALVLTRPPR